MMIEQEGDKDERPPNAAAAESDPDWTGMLSEAPSAQPVEAVTVHSGPWASISKPVCVQCSDKVFRVIKRPLPPHVHPCLIFNDQVIARLASYLGAPVPAPAVVNLSAALIALDPRLAHMTPGLCHGSEFRDGHGGRKGVENWTLPENRERFAKLAILYGWVHGSDLQQIYPDSPPFMVLSVDHGHFISDGSPWTASTLIDIPAAVADPGIVGQAAISDEELALAAASLEPITPINIAAAVAASPDEWGVLASDRAALCAYFWRRRAELLILYGRPATMPDASAASTEATGKD